MSEHSTLLSYVSQIPTSDPGTTWYCLYKCSFLSILFTHTRLDEDEEGNAIEYSEHGVTSKNGNATALGRPEPYDGDGVQMVPLFYQNALDKMP